MERCSGTTGTSSARTARLLENPEEIGVIAAQADAAAAGGAAGEDAAGAGGFCAGDCARDYGQCFRGGEWRFDLSACDFFRRDAGEQVAGENVTIVDDGTMVFDLEGTRVGGFGTSAFDGEGLPTRRTVIVERGVLKSYVMNTYTARKLGLRSTGNASRGLAGNPGIGAGNFYLEAGDMTPEALIGEVKQGLYVTEVMGFGVNLVTGDYSQGAAGLWIENGELAYPVEEITIAGNLKDMYRNISAIGNDLRFRGASASPTIRVEGMMIAGG